MTNARVVCSGVLALVLPATLGLSCIERDWSLCSPQDECHPGYTCTADWHCVRQIDGGADGLAAIDSQAVADGTVGIDGPALPDAGPAIGRDAGEPDFAPVSAPPDTAVGAGLDGPEPYRAPVSASPDALADAAPDAPLVAVPDAPADAVPDAPAPDVPVATVPDVPAADAPPVGPTVDAAGTCSTDKDCSPQSPLCLGSRCAKCTGDNDCANRPGTPACVAASGLCVACTANKYCTGAAGTCETATNQCVGCVTRSDCGGACQTCTRGVCTAVKNQDDVGFCAGTCDSTGACKSKQGQPCQTAGGGCAAGTTCAPDGVCCDSACDQACRSCLGSKTEGVDGICANMTNGTTCGGASGHYCSAGTCGSGCLISGTFYTSGAVSSTNPCQTCQPAVSPTSWSPLGNGTSCGSGLICNGGNCQTGCWIGGSFIGSGATNSTNICQICSPTNSTTGWSNNDAAKAVPCGGCGGTAACSNMVLGNCSKNAATFYEDNDSDGWGNSFQPTVVACTAPIGYSPKCCDCDDNDSTMYPGISRCFGPGSPTTLNTCASDGSQVVTTCPDDCAHGQCRSFNTINTPGQVTCGSTQCSASVGCSFADGSVYGPPPVCGSAGSTNWYALCDGPNDCGAGQVCCYFFNGPGSYEYTKCAPNDGTTCPHADMGANYARIVCDPSNPQCPAGNTCTKLGGQLSGYVCQ